MADHTLRLRSRLIRGRVTRFWGECECGWRSADLQSAGLVHSEHSRHVAAARIEERDA